MPLSRPNASEAVVILPPPYTGFCGTHWLDSTTFLVCTLHTERPATGHDRVDRLALPIRCLRYGISNLETPNEIVLPVARKTLFYHGYQLFDDVSRALLFKPLLEPSPRDKVRAYGINGFRNATEREAEKFEAFAKEVPADGPDAKNGPSISLEEMKRHVLVTKVLEYLGHPSRRRLRLELDAKLVRKLQGGAEWAGISYPPVWDEDLQLCRWVEFDADGAMRSYYADAEGHYRCWCIGEFWAAVPRNSEDDEDETEE